MSLLLVSFFAGILTILAPCVLPLLPVILGGSASNKNKWYPYIVIGSLGVSIFIFTLLLKATSLLINVPPSFWTSVSGVILVFFGLISLFPQIWDRISIKLKLSQNSDQLLDKAQANQSIWQPVLLGAALGPVFSSCSFTYALLLATVLPANFWWGIANMLAYILGLTLIMLFIAILGSRLIKKLKFAANPNGLFKRGLGLLFLIVGILIMTGYDKVFQVWVSEKLNYDITNIEKKVLQDTNITKDNSVVFEASTSQNNSLTNTLNLSTQSKGENAPEFVGLGDWVNSTPLTMQSLKGKVVLVDFWTYSCINCIRTQPYLNAWYDTYKDKNFVIIGIHTPEFAFEKKIENVSKAIKDAKISYPVALDNDFSTWNAFKNQYWPAKYLIDKNGQIRYTHFGEGQYDETEKVIQSLIAETGVDTSSNMVSTNVKSDNLSLMPLTPETYLGWSRAKGFIDSKDTVYNEAAEYSLKTNLNLNSWSLGGNWQINNENIISKKDGNKLRFRYSGKDVFLVMGSSSETQVKIISDKNSTNGLDASDGVIKVKDYRLYKLIQNQNYNPDGFIELEFPAGVEANAFTFG